jgi:hypothetical protein
LRLVGLVRRGEPALRLGFLVSAFIVLEVNLYYNQVTIPRRGILYDLELDILVVECLEASFSTRRFSNIVIVISIINIIPRFDLVIVGVFGVIYRIQLFIVQIIEVRARLLLINIRVLGILL